jgi:hypothetical protein
MAAASGSGERPSRCDELSEGGRLDELHHQVEPVVVVEDVVDDDGGAVVEPGRGPGLVEDPGPRAVPLVGGSSSGMSMALTATVRPRTVSSAARRCRRHHVR